MSKVDYSDKNKKQLSDILDDWFSRFIRLRDSDKYEMLNCCTCGRRVHWKSADCGHYVKRGHSATRFDEKNCAGQCRWPCNRRRNGEEQAHRLYINHKYGEGTAEFLKEKGRHPFEMTREEYIEKIEHYREIVTNDPRYK